MQDPAGYPRDVLPDKFCAVCGRTIAWRKKWERSWAEVKYCSEKCRSNKSSRHSAIESEILRLLHERAVTSTMCPSEVARSLNADDWRPLMEPVREAARRLVVQGLIDITQGGQVVDASTARGPIRLRRRRAPAMQ